MGKIIKFSKTRFADQFGNEYSYNVDDKNPILEIRYASGRTVSFRSKNLVDSMKAELSESDKEKIEINDDLGLNIEQMTEFFNRIKKFCMSDSSEQFDFLGEIHNVLLSKPAKVEKIENTNGKKSVNKMIGK